MTSAQTDPDAQRTKSFLHDMKFDLRPTEHGMAGTFEVTEEMLVPGTGRVQLGVLATVADVAMGTPVSDVLGKSIVGLTVDLVVRSFGDLGVGSHRLDARVIKRGRTLAVAETTFFAGAGNSPAVAGHSLATFMPIEIDGPFAMPMPKRGARIGDGALGAPFVDALGVVVERPGVATVDRRPYTLQPAGTIQGGVVCTLAEVAAQSLLGGPVADLDVRFLAQVKHGPARATAERLDERNARVVIVDAGSGDPRPTAHAIARLA